jgi:hypothetical protein
MNNDGFKNALPSEVDDHPDSGMPRQMRTPKDNTADDADAATAGVRLANADTAVYGDDSVNPNEDDQHDEHEADADDVV